MPPIDHTMALPQGAQIQDFVVRQVLGHDGFGITYLGWNFAQDIPVIIQEYLPPNLAIRGRNLSVVPKSSDDETEFKWGLDQFLDMARTMTHFKHPNIVKVHRFFQSHGTAYVVMEYIEGESLASLLKRRGTLMEKELKSFLLPLLTGLVEVHSAGIVHRNIKPDNILLRASDGSPVLIGFGSIRQAVINHNPGFTPIEQYSSQGHLGPWTDIYALGCVCYQALVGKVPVEAIDRVRNDPLVPITQAGRGKAKHEFLVIIDWCLRVNEMERPRRMHELYDALLGDGKVYEQPSAGSSTQQASPLNVPPRVSPGNHPWLYRLLFMFGVIILVLTGTMWTWQTYPDLFGQGGEGSPNALDQELQSDSSREKPGQVDTADLNPNQMKTPPDTIPKHEQLSSKKNEQTSLSEDIKITHLLEAAEKDLKARRLTSPAGNNAWEKYQRVLELAPSHPKAIVGMEQVIKSYLDLFDSALIQEDFEKAASYLDRIRSLHPDSPMLEEGEQRLVAAKQARAELLAKLDQQRLQTIKEYWRAFRAALDNGEFEEATKYLTKVRKLNPKAPGLMEAEIRLDELEEMQRQETEAKLKQLVGEMVLIPGGTFRMGDLRDSGDDDERPVHTVAIPSFKLGKYEVTVSQFRHFIQATAYRTDAEKNAYDHKGCFTKEFTGRNEWGWTMNRTWRNQEYSIKDNQPVVCVSWNDALAFTQWLTEQFGETYRLPSEAEWEYAARAGSESMYYFGNTETQLCEYANLADKTKLINGERWGYEVDCYDDAIYPATVGNYRPNTFGLHDMHGNVWEWVQDCYSDNYIGAPRDGSTWLSGDCSRRVIRGGSWTDTPRNVRSANRSMNLRSLRHGFVGFRLAKDL